jgi:hypothetical protein
MGSLVAWQDEEQLRSSLLSYSLSHAFRVADLGGQHPKGKVCCSWH